MVRSTFLAQTQGCAIAGRSLGAPATLAVGGIATLGIIAISLFPPRPRFIWNASASAAIGLYHLTPVAHPTVGMLVAITPPAPFGRYLDARRYLPLGVPLLKHVAAGHGSRVCRFGRRITLNGRLAAFALDRDRQGRPLPRWRGCRIVGRSELFLLNPAPDSMDGRYFGSIPASGLLGCATPLLVRNRPGEPLRWRGLAFDHASSTRLKGPSLCK